MGDLTPVQLKAIVYLASGKSNQQAATLTGVSLSTIEKWKKKPNFKKVMQEAVVRLFDQSLANLVLLAEEVVEELREIIREPENSPKIKISAANIVLAYASKAKESILEQRLERVEALLDGTDSSED